MDEAAGSSNPPPTSQPAEATAVNSAPNSPSTGVPASTTGFSERPQHGYPPTTDRISPETHAVFNLFASHRASQMTLTLLYRTAAPLPLDLTTGAQSELAVSLPVRPSILKKRTYQESISTSAGGQGETVDGPGDHDATATPDAKRQLRGQPRVHFHPSAGHQGGEQHHRSQRGRATPAPSGTSLAANLHQPPLLASSPGARANPGSSAAETSTPPSCAEKPEYFPRPWPARSFFTKGRDRTIDVELVLHSADVKRCENADKHETPYHVCATCRDRAASHIRRMNPGLFEPKWLPLCKPCGSAAVSSLLADRAQQGLGNPLLGCRCDYAYLCCECRIREMEVAMAKYQAEVEMRMSIVVVGYVDDVENKCGSWRMNCFCGGSLQKGDVTLLRCSGCWGVKSCT
ncbi:MAG: hypothetical protein Q9167_006054 [Letrouitia subvulpina]